MLATHALIVYRPRAARQRGDGLGAKQMSHQQITPEETAFYVVEFPTGEHGETERTVVQYEHGRFWSTNEAAYDDVGPPPAEASGYTVIRKIELLAA
jgi:hypothetical protein